MTSNDQTPSSFSTISTENRIDKSLKIIKDNNKTKFFYKGENSFYTFHKYELFFKSLTQKQKNNIKRNLGCFKREVHPQKPQMINKLMTNSEFLGQVDDFLDNNSNKLLISKKFLYSRFFRIHILKEFYNKGLYYNYVLNDFGWNGVYNDNYEASLIHHKNIIVNAMRKYIKKRKEKATIIQKAFLKCKYSPYTKIGQKYINKLYDQNFEEEEDKIEGENIMICDNKRLLEMKQNRFKSEVSEMRKYILLLNRRRDLINLLLN